LEEQGRTSLHLAVINNDLAMVDNLLREGASVNLIDSNIMTPLAIAISDGKTEIAKCLLKQNYGLNMSLG